MAITVHVYLDKRSVNRGEEAPLKIGINKQGSSAYINLGKKIYPTQWDSQKERIKNRPDKASIQSYIDTQKTLVSNTIMDLTKKGELTKLTATQVKNKVLSIIEPTAETANCFYSRFMAYTDSRSAKRTKDIYKVTANKMAEFDSKIKTKSFEDITKDWLNSFDSFLMKSSPSINGRSIHFRNIRAVFRDAMDNEITMFYPFRIFKIKSEQTQKRSLTLSELRTLFAVKGSKRQQKAIDLFKLSLFLIGINITDLCHLQDIGADGCIHYKRQKTQKLYCIKVEPEALALIDKYRGKKYLLNILDNYKNVHTFTIAFSKQLQTINGFSNLTSYWARHTWATIASELDIPVDIISHALGHSFSTGAKVTQVYINFNQQKIDEANRKVIDYILYDKKATAHREQPPNAVIPKTI